MNQKKTLMAAVKASLFGSLVLLCQDKCPGNPSPPVPDQAARSPGEAVTGLYALVSSTAGKVPDWDRVRACFLKEAVIVLRTSRTASTVFSLEGFIKDFSDFYHRPFRRDNTTVAPKDSGFTETVLRTKALEYGDMAHVLVLYEARITGFPMAPQRGIDSWLLVRRGGRWLIAAVTNELVTPGRPVPAELSPDNPKASGPSTQKVTP
jgi:hypothetical protein